MTNMQTLLIIKNAATLGRGLPLARLFSQNSALPLAEDITRELAPHGGNMPAILAAENPRVGPVSGAYRGLLANRIRQHRMRGRYERVMGDMPKMEAMQGPYNDYETRAKRYLAQLSQPSN